MKLIAQWNRPHTNTHAYIAAHLRPQAASTQFASNSNENPTSIKIYSHCSAHFFTIPGTVFREYHSFFSCALSLSLSRFLAMFLGLHFSPIGQNMKWAKTNARNETKSFVTARKLYHFHSFPMRFLQEVYMYMLHTSARARVCVCATANGVQYV